MTKQILFVLLIASTNCFSQYYKSYDWSEKPKLHTITADEQKEHSIGILKKNIVEYTTAALTSDLKAYETFHTITRVNDEKGIGQHNTVYIPMYDVKNVIDIKARTINSKGKITLLNKDNIKEVKNVEEYGDFKIFAIEGVEKNSEIEVLYTVEKNADLFGSETLQSNYKIKTAQFLYITGDLNSEIKAYRTASKFESVTTDGKASKLLEIKNIPAMIEEEYATPDANKIAVVYQCFPKGQNITQEMFWNNVVTNVGNKIIPETVNPKVDADIQTITKGQKDLTTYQKIVLVDNFVKSNFTVVKNNNEELSDLDYVLKNRSSSDFGILKVYANYFKTLDVAYELVITANRFTYKFDPDFFIPNMLRDFLIYIPSEDKYISPDRVEYRVGEAPFNILGNYGLFINEEFGYYFSKIVQSDPNFSTIKRNTDITFNDDFESATLKQHQEYTGHWSITNRAVLSLSSDQGIKEFKDYLTGSGIEDKVIESYEVENGDMNQTEYNKPFITKSTISSESIIEDAGDSYLFQIGKVIGTQSELYQETERVNPIEMTYPNQYDYTITVNIPDGYTVEGLNSLNIDKSYKSNSTGEKICKFESSYKLEGNKLIITIQEFYKSNEYDLNRYEEFRSVINAASDFNKASIVFKTK
ncbi:hypothetical protein GCM10011531_16230 [Aquaticitalea lipolytica]|uniref:DUF3857 domain-containing protein n=1 Tax=Aquaticitalea lipolytica TaxID=1247562 RepID=A0A8J2XFZ4_9FLAO|nr:DUF3857 domain-containing protein [Aquaticitalea lipolytica]GFZ85677.1 hypothetical protein GCM10011531_16230 [Aquaticitalea lipolytica]